MGSFPFGLGWRVFRNSFRLKLDGVRDYNGGADFICEEVVEDCWNGSFFQTSTTHFPQFWTRDFGWCVDSLLSLGFDRRVRKSLLYALDCFSKQGRVGTTISPRGKVFDYPTQAVDSLPWLLYSIKRCDSGLFDRFNVFLDDQIRSFYNSFIDKKSGLVRSDRFFSSIKDLAKRRSSCYSNTMVGLMSNVLKDTNLVNPFKDYDYSSLLVDNFWNGTGEYFYDDLKKKDYVSADANIFPFWTGVVEDNSLLEKALGSIQRECLDKPFPIRYTNRDASVSFRWQEFFLRGYELDSVWMHMGPLYVKLVGRVDSEKAEEYKRLYSENINKYGNFLEVFDAKTEKPFTTPFYHSDEGMLWACNYLTL